MKRPHYFASLLLALIMSVALIHAQSACPTLVNSALAAIDANCKDISRNSACYGYNRVSATFTEEVPDDYFAVPSDVTGLATLKTIQTTALDTALDQWGVAFMSVQANLPDTLPGQAVTFILMGDAEMENGVQPEDVTVSADPITVVTTVNANIRSGASKNYNTLGTAPENTSLSADGLSTDSQWLRVIFDDKPAWVSRSVLADNPAIDTLPVLDSTQRTPMQAFYLRTGVGEPTCAEAPANTLMVQGPKNIKIDLTVNGADIQLGSTILIRTPSPGIMEIIVLDGEVTIKGGGDNGEDVVIRQGYRSQVCLSEPENLGIDGTPNDRVVSCRFSPPEAVLESDLGADWCTLQNIPAELLHYAVDLRCPGDPVTENANTSDNSNANTGGTGSGECADFVTLSPTSGSVDFKNATYSWTAVNGADQYALNFTSSQGVYMTTQLVDGSQTSTTLSNANLADAFFTWQVTALKGGVILCSTPASAILERAPNPEAPPQQAVNTGTVSQGCSSSYSVEFTWQGFNPSETFSIVGSPFSAGSGSGSGGVYDTGSYYSDYATITTSSGYVYNFGSLYCGGD